MQFAAAHNQLTGTLPNAFATATRLQVLNLAGVSVAGCLGGWMLGGAAAISLNRSFQIGQIWRAMLAQSWLELLP